MKPYDEISDEELIKRVRTGETEILDYLMEKYKDMVKKKARTMFLVGGDNDDLIQEGMIGLFKAVRDYQPDKDASFQTFARMCVERQLYNAIQTSNRQKHQPLNSYVSLSQEDAETENHLKEMWVDNPESIIIDEENTRKLQKDITATLSPMENQVLQLYLDGNRYTDIASIMKKTPKSIDNALHRIKSKIREQLEDA